MGFFGEMGSGKGISSTRFLRQQRQKFYKKIISNCYLNDKDVIRLDTEQLYEKYLQPDFFDDSYLYITELHTLIDSRRSNSLMNTNFTMFLTQLGKRDCFVIYDSQLSGQIDLRMREFTPYRIICKKFVFQDETWKKAEFGTPRKIRLPIMILELIQYEDLNGNTITQPYNVYEPTQEDFNYYNTSEIIIVDRQKFMK